MMINKKNTKETITNEVSYGFYSKVLKQPFDTIDELKAAEAKHYTELKAKEDKAAQKKADAKKVEDAFKALNAARKTYKEDLTVLTQQYSEDLVELKNRFEFIRDEIKATLADAEKAYQNALKEFTAKYDQFHLSLRDGDFETTIHSDKKVNTVKPTGNIMDLFDLFFNF